MKLSLSDAHALVCDVLVRSKVAPENAYPVATALIAAEAAGQSGHGLRRVPAYAAQAQAGKVDGFARPVAVKPAPAVLRIDAQYGFAYPALEMMMAQLPDMARAQGIAICAIHKSHHAGVMGLTVERFAEQGLAAMAFANAPAAMAPWGGSRPMFGTNPIAFAVPVPGADPIVIDLALSRVARGKIMAARQKNEPIPEGWALDVDGNPTTDAQKALDGTMIPAGGVKGAALAMMVELLSAGLTGAQYGHQSSSLFDDKGAPPALGQMVIAIDPTATGGGDGVLAHLGYIAGELTREEGVRLPGRRGQGSRARAEAEGIEIEDDVMATIRAIGA